MPRTKLWDDETLAPEWEWSPAGLDGSFCEVCRAPTESGPRVERPLEQSRLDLSAWAVEIATRTYAFGEPTSKLQHQGRWCPPLHRYNPGRRWRLSGWTHGSIGNDADATHDL